MKGRSAVHGRSGKVLADELEMPRTMFGRGVGLMFRKKLDPGRGMWINPCSGIHMMFMNFPIDAVFLDRRERVKKVYRKLPAWYGVVWWVIGARSGRAFRGRAGVTARRTGGASLQLRGQRPGLRLASCEIGPSPRTRCRRLRSALGAASATFG